MFDVNYLLDSIDTFTESVEAHFESVARSLQDTFRQTPWIPDAVKPRPPPPSRTLPTVRSPAGYFEVTKTWISEHRAVTAAILAFVGTGALIVWRGRRYRAKRRARRTKSGARTEVVVLYGSPHSPLTRALSLDLERKGYIVYIPVSTLSEEQLIQAFSRPDIRPLSLDITSVRPYKILAYLCFSVPSFRNMMLTVLLSTALVHTFHHTKASLLPHHP